MNKFEINLNNIYDFVSNKQVFTYKEELMRNLEMLEEKTGKGSDFIGWLNLPSSIADEQLTAIEEVANDLRSISEVVVVIGIGGSYLGAKAVIEALSSSFSVLKPNKGNPLIIFAGQNICEDYHFELMGLLDSRKYSIVVISKSGTTTEPAVAFRLLKQHLENKVGKRKLQIASLLSLTDQKVHYAC